MVLKAADDLGKGASPEQIAAHAVKVLVGAAYTRWCHMSFIGTVPFSFLENSHSMVELESQLSLYGGEWRFRLAG